MKKIYTLGVGLLLMQLVHAQNVGIGTNTPFAKLQVAAADSSILMLDNASASDDSVKSRLYFRTNNFFTGGIGTHITNRNSGNIPYARLGFFTYGSNIASDLVERMVITDEGRVGINTLSPTALLDVNGGFRLRGGNPGAGKVLTSDAAGNASWQNAASGFTLPFSGSMSTAGDAFSITKSGTGSALYITSNDVSATSWITNTGATGSASFFRISDAANPGFAIDADHFGTGDAIRGIGRGTGAGGRFLITNPSSTIPALIGSTQGPGAGIGAYNYGTGPGLVVQQGAGGAALTSDIARFETNNSNSYSTIARITKGGKFYLYGSMTISDGTQGAGKVLTSDASGNASWQNAFFSLPYDTDQAYNGSLLSVNNTATTGSPIGIYGLTNSTSNGSATTGPAGIVGEVVPTAPGGFSAGVKGINRGTGGNGIGVIGYHAGSGFGIYGESASGVAVYAAGSSGVGIYANITGSGNAINAFTSSGTALNASSTSGLALRTASGNVIMENMVVIGNNTTSGSSRRLNVYNTSSAVYANTSGGNSAAYIGDGYIGIQATATGSNSGRQAVRADNAGSATGYAGYFNGNVSVQGTLSKTAGSFIIDHPLDPDNKYLVHSFVESPDMKNIYDGVITTDVNGEATVTMPEWFQALNMDFRYQLTCINQFAQAIIYKEISGNQFIIKTDKPSVKVSWQVTGTRNDVYARERRLPVEKEKAPGDKGKYIYPQGYGFGQDKSIAPAMATGGK